MLNIAESLSQFIIWTINLQAQIKCWQISVTIINFSLKAQAKKQTNIYVHQNFLALTGLIIHHSDGFGLG